MVTRTYICTVVACVIGLSAISAIAGQVDLPPLITPPVVRIEPAVHSAEATHVQILAATVAGRRLIAVGDHGVVLLSDDGGKSFAQARSVPVDSTLTSVSFVDEKNGWAVGHWGAIIRTRDGGESWVLQHSDIKVDQPLFGVHFEDARNGWAVGLWSLLLRTGDGGATWTSVKVPPPPGAKKADRNFFSIFADGKGVLYVACEQGLVLRSRDGGVTWTYVQTGYDGSFWTGIALHDGSLLVGGLRGSVYRSTDGGATWQRSQNSYKSSITGFAEDPEGTVSASSLDGVILKSNDGGRAFIGFQRAGRDALTAVAEATLRHPVFFSEAGVVR